MHSLHAYCDSYTSTKHLLVVCTFFNFVAMKIKIEIEIEIASFCQDCRKDQALLPFVGRSFERIDRHFFSGGSLHHCHAAYKYEFRWNPRSHSWRFFHFIIIRVIVYLMHRRKKMNHHFFPDPSTTCYIQLLRHCSDPPLSNGRDI